MILGGFILLAWDVLRLNMSGVALLGTVLIVCGMIRAVRVPWDQDSEPAPPDRGTPVAR